MLPRRFTLRFWLAGSLSMACGPSEHCEIDSDSGPGPDTGSVEWPDELSFGPAVSCESPVSSFDRLQEESRTRGLDFQLEVMPQMQLGNINGGLSAADLDKDGHLDLIFGSTSGMPIVMLNDGKGHFQELAGPNISLLDLFGTAAAQHGVIDVDADGWIDLLQVGLGAVWVYWNQEGAAFSEPELLWGQTAAPYGQFGTMAWGDVDSDGDLDLLLPGLELRGGTSNGGQDQGGMPVGHPEVLLLNTDRGFVESQKLSPWEVSGVNITATFTDRDDDGDQDLFVPSDLGQISGEYPPSAFYRNDGLDASGDPVYVDDAPEIGADLRMSSMGISTSDWNADGLLDYCISDTGPIRCLLSAPDGSFYEAGQALGLEDPEPLVQGLWSGWGMEFIDIDNDGLEDVVAAGGQPIGGAAAGRTYVDAIWQGVADSGMPQFENRTATHAFGQLVDHYGLVSADFDGDGFVEVVVSGAPGPIAYWQNQCGEGAWSRIELLNSGPNWEAYGARIDLTVGEKTWTREVQNMHAMSQHTASHHFGLGAATKIDHLKIRWPDGMTVEYTDLPVRRSIAIQHPSL